MELNELKKLVSFNKKFLIILLILVGVVMLSSYSYALYQVNFIKHNVVVLRSASNLNITTTIDDTNSDTFTIPASGNKTIVVHLDTDGVTSAMAYKMYYELTGTGSFNVTSNETFTNNKVEGIMQPYERTNNEKITGKNITLTFTNNLSTALTIKLGAIGGYEKTGASLTNQDELVIGSSDSENPTLSLSKITYLLQDLTTWNNNGTTITNGVLTIPNTSANTTSNYINVNGGFWYLTFDFYSENVDETNHCRAYYSSTYFDSNYQSVINNEGYPTNGWGFAFSPNEWHNDENWYSNHSPETYPRYGSNVKYITIYFENYNAATVPYKIRNVKIWGEAIPNSFYLINVTSSDNIGVVTTKYAKGNQNIDYFENNGYAVINNQINVTENGIYTVYVADAAGNATIETINITDIV